MVDITTGLAFLTGLGLPEVLLWVLSFAVVFAVLTKLKILGRAPATLVSIVAGILVLMAVPAAAIQVIAGMSTGLVVLAIGIIALVAVLEVAQVRHFERDEKGKIVDAHPWLTGHSTAVAAVLIVLAAILFVATGGLPLIGIAGIPVIGWGTAFLILVGIAVLWMLSEAK